MSNVNERANAKRWPRKNGENGRKRSKPLRLRQRLGLLAQLDALDALAAAHDLHGRGVDLAQVLLGLREMALEIVDPLLQAPRVAHHQGDQLLDLAGLLAHL